MSAALICFKLNQKVSKLIRLGYLELRKLLSRERKLELHVFNSLTLKLKIVFQKNGI